MLERIRRRVGVGVALVFIAAVVSSASAETLHAPKLAYRDRTLPNGLRVLSLVDHNSPTVSIQVWYKVGSKDDPDGRSGFAHLFEHLMFKSTKRMKAETMDRLTEDVGGENNAYTADDVTVYWEVVPSNHLERLLWAEAERMSNLNVDDANFKSEREVVKEEYRQSVLAPPYGRLFYLMDQKSFLVHPYRRPTIGSIEELDAASLENVRKFHSTFYRPDNAALIVVGDFDQEKLDAWTNQYFASIAKPSEAIPRVTAKEPPRKQETRVSAAGPNVPLPAVVFTYLIPPKASPDSDALRVAESILSSGESSRLYQSLVYEKQVAQSVESRADLREDVSLFSFLAIAAGGKTPAEVEAALLAEIKKAQDAPATSAELEKAKNQLLTRQFLERETNNGKAAALGDAAVLLGDVERVNTDIEHLSQVTAEDVQRVMKKYLTDANRLVIDYAPEPETRNDAAEKKDQPKGNSDAAGGK